MSMESNDLYRYLLEPTTGILSFSELSVTSVTLVSASRLNFSHDDFQTDSDWFFKINDICVSNRKPGYTLTNRIQSAFSVYFFKILQNTWTVR